MSKNKPNLTSVLVDMTKWSGKYTFFFLVFALILGAISISLADPSGSVYRTNGDFSVIQNFSVSKDDSVQLMMETVSGQKFEYRLEFVESVNGTDVYTEILQVNDYQMYRNENLKAGDYRILVKGEAGQEVFIGTAQFDLGLVTAVIVMIIIFAICISIFSFVLPFAIMALVGSALTRESHTIPPVQQPQRQESSSPPQYQEPIQETQSDTRPASVRTPKKRTSMQIFSDTPLAQLKRNDWYGLGLALIFLILFLVEPDGPLFFFALITVIFVVYSVTEREKMKDRLIVLLGMYPKTSVKFLARQLDKKEKNVTQVLRYMILDDGYAIRLDLINKTVEKIGQFPEEKLGSKGTVITTGPLASDVVSPQVKTQQEVSHEEPESVRDEPIPDDPVQESVGEVMEPATYCSACGEPLLQETKYCYYCGARQ